MNNQVLNNLYSRSSPVDAVVDSYTYLGMVYPTVFRIFYVNNLLTEPAIKRGVDVPEYVYDFILEEGKSLGIINLVGGQVLSITFRSLKEKKFMSYRVFKSIPLGFGTFSKDFKFSDPVVVVEGPKDLYSLYQIYPNIIATQTAGISTSNREFLKGITDKVIILGDSDTAGNKAYYEDKKRLSKEGISVYRVEHPTGVKDCGEIVDLEFQGRQFDADYLKEYYKNALTPYIG